MLWCQLCAAGHDPAASLHHCQRCPRFADTVSIEVTSTQVGGEQQLTLAGSESRSELVLTPLQEGSKVQWDRLTRACKPMSEDEADAYERLSKTLEEHPSVVTVKVTGPLQKDEDGKYSLQVREFEVETAPTAS